MLEVNYSGAAERDHFIQCFSRGTIHADVLSLVSKDLALNECLELVSQRGLHVCEKIGQVGEVFKLQYTRGKQARGLVLKVMKGPTHNLKIGRAHV